jgi:hypothetical protein
MSIVLPLAHSVQRYLRRFAQVGPDLHLYCPCCSGERLHRHGRYWRVVVSRRRISRIPIYRWRCPKCRHTVSLLPDFLKPYARFLSLLREKAVWRRAAGWAWDRIALAVSSAAVSVVSIRTLLRWWQSMLRWAHGRGAEPAGRILEAAPAVALGDLRPAGAGSAAVAQFLRDTGQILQCQVGPLRQGNLRSHPGLYAFLNSFLGGLPYL